jgi:acyl-CoA synthetase (AMP-forming)/AMP-acid ligase II
MTLNHGAPQGVVHTHRQVMVNAIRAVDMCAFTTQDVWLHAAPMFHAMVRFGCGGVGGFPCFLLVSPHSRIHACVQAQ